MWDKLSSYCIAISKYLLTAVVIAAFFKDIESKWILYITGTIAALSLLGIGLAIVKYKNDKNGSTK